LEEKAMQNMLTGKVALVTGAAGDVGRAIVTRFLEEGAAVVATDFNDQVLRKTVAAFAEKGGKVVGQKHDVTSEDDWRRVVDVAVATFGRLDILVNCAGAIKVVLIESMDYADWKHIMAVNCDGAFLGMKAALPALKDAAKDSMGGGSIINIASAQGLKAGQPGLSAYTASKGGLRLLTRNAAVEFGRLGYKIRCNAVVPSAMGGTAMMDTLIKLQVERGVFKSFEHGMTTLNAVFPLGHTGEPLDVAEAAVFLASDRAKHITGIDLPVDGGVCA
jgi:NAD(P)-dependent dehydrogenase (short-subunit alcohol dehydrogenase family)